MENKIIVAKMQIEHGEYSQRGSCPYVIVSTHPRFGPGTRLDWRFLGIALDQGYNVLFVANVIPELAAKWEEGDIVRESPVK